MKSREKTYEAEAWVEVEVVSPSMVFLCCAVPRGKLSLWKVKQKRNVKMWYLYWMKKNSHLMLLWRLSKFSTSLFMFWFILRWWTRRNPITLAKNPTITIATRISIGTTKALPCFSFSLLLLMMMNSFVYFFKEFFSSPGQHDAICRVVQIMLNVVVMS